MNSAQLTGITPDEIEQRFAAKEATFQTARERYGYTLNIDVQTLDNYNRPDGEYAQTSEVTLNDVGKRVELSTYAPQSTLSRLSLTQDDLDDIRQRLEFPFTPDQLPSYSFSYVGRQTVDQLGTYVFDVLPKPTKKRIKLFEGRIWVDDQDLIVVKTCGKPRGDQGKSLTRKNAIVDLAPVFVTFREQIDGKYWFPTYARADELLRFPGAFVHIREVVKFSNYKPLSRSD
jgi:hypothetical protein